MIAILLALLLGSTSQIRTTLYEQVDLIELNHCANDIGSLCYSQVIVWEWSATYRRYDVRMWWIVDKDESPVLRNGQYYFRTVRSAMFRETHTPSSNDPERMNQKLLPPEQRRALSSGNRKK